MDELRLRPVRAADLDDLVARQVAAREDDPWSFWGYRAEQPLRRAFEEDGFLGEDRGRLLVVLGEAVIGDVDWRAAHYGPPQTSRCWNIGISLSPEFRGQGHGGPAQRLLVIYLFDTTTAERVEASTDIENVAEQRALEKAGFTREGILRRAQFRAGHWHDLALYAITRPDLTTA